MIKQLSHLSHSDRKFILDLVTRDIKGNRLCYGKRTKVDDVMEILNNSLPLLRYKEGA